MIVFIVEKENKSTLLDQAEDDAEERQKKEDELEEAREEAEDRAEASSVIPWSYVKFHVAMTLASLYQNSKFDWSHKNFSILIGPK